MGEGREIKIIPNVTYRGTLLCEVNKKDKHVLPYSFDVKIFLFTVAIGVDIS